MAGEYVKQDDLESTYGDEDKQANQAALDSQMADPNVLTKQAAQSPVAAAATQAPASPGIKQQIGSFLGQGPEGGNNAALLSSLIGANAGTASTNAGQAASQGTYQNAWNNYQNLYNQANPANLQVALNQAQMTNYSPAYMQSTPNMGASAFQNVGPNQDILNQQMANNAQLQQVSKSGFTPEMMAAYNSMLNSNNASLQSNLAGIQQSQAARGMGSSGASLALKENANQAALNNASTASQNIAGQGFQNKLAAMNQLGGLTNAQQSQLSNIALQQASGLQQNQQFQNKLVSDIAAQNVARQQQQANLQTQSANQFSQSNNAIANQQAYQNMVNNRIQAATMANQAAGGMLNAGKGISQAQINQGAIQGTAQGITGTNLGGILGNYLQNPSATQNGVEGSADAAGNAGEYFGGSEGLESLDGVNDLSGLDNILDLV